MNKCQVEGCGKGVSKAGYLLCLDHWRAERDGRLGKCAGCGRFHAGSGAYCQACASLTITDDDSPAGYLSATKIGKRFSISNIKVNLILAELGWIERYTKGWVPTDRGNAMGANVREMRNGVPFVVWPERILTNPALLASITEQGGSSTPYAQLADSPAADFRNKYPATHRAQDGHMVRSRAEVLIDNWLYMQGIVHAYERRLPVEEECYCDFYLPKGKGVYIEFWGRESEAKYRERQEAKRAIYKKYELRLIELGDAEIERLDDVLPRMLLRFGIESV